MRTIIPKDAKLIPEKAERVFKGQIFDVYQWQQEMFDGSYETFEMLKRPDTVKVIALKEEKIIICEEQQPNTQVSLMYQRTDMTTIRNPIGAAKRELWKKTGMAFADWEINCY